VSIQLKRRRTKYAKLESVENILKLISEVCIRTPSLTTQSQVGLLKWSSPSDSRWLMKSKFRMFEWKTTKSSRLIHIHHLFHADQQYGHYIPFKYILGQHSQQESQIFTSSSRLALLFVLFVSGNSLSPGKVLISIAGTWTNNCQLTF
jgi:hypothetical protein